MLYEANLNVSKVGVFKGGWKENKSGQLKKHFTQMTGEEKSYLAFRLNEMKLNFKIHPHLQKKKQRGEVSYDILTIKKTLSSKIVQNLIKEYSTVEYDNGEVDKRVLVRSSRKEMVRIRGRGRHLCYLYFVISLETNEVITAYYAHHKHQFKQNNSRYSKDLHIY